MPNFLRQPLFRTQFLSKRSLQSVLMGTVFVGASIAQMPVSLSASPSPGSIIENQATGSFVNPVNSQQVNIESNKVQVTVAEVAGVTLIPAGIQEAPATVSNPGPNQGDSNFDAGDVVYFLFTATNVGNDPTQFFIPGAPSSLSNGTQSGQIEIIELDPDGASGPTAPTDFSSVPITILPSGNNTGDATAMGLPVGAIPAGGSITLRVPIKANAGLLTNDTISLTLGDVSPTANNNSAATQNQDYINNNNRDFYTQDNDSDNGIIITDEAPGRPINGDATLHRKEASASSTLTIGGNPSNSHILSGFVFQDDDGSNAQNGTEVGLQNVTVRLFIDVNNDGEITIADDSDGDADIDAEDAIAVTNTNSTGFYQFNRPNGNYLIQVDTNDSDLIAHTYGGITGTANDPLNLPRNADINNADITTGLNFPFDRLVGPPIIDLDDDNSSGATGYDFQNVFTADGPAIAAADSDVNIEDNGTIISSATIILTNRPDGNANEILSITDGNGVTASAYNETTGTISLSGDASLAVYENIISTLTYDNTVTSPDLTDRRITVQVTDNNGLDSNIAETLLSIRTLSNIVPNPNFNGSCTDGIKIALVLDASGSVDSGERVLTRAGVKDFLNQIAAQAPAGQVQVSIIEFATRSDLAVPYTPVTTANVNGVFTTYLDTQYPDHQTNWSSVDINTFTNWEAGFKKTAQTLDNADVMIFTTDGNPNTILTQDANGNDTTTNNNAGSTANAIAATVPWANQIKFQGTHIYAVGITDDPNDVNVPDNFYDLLDGNPGSTDLNTNEASFADFLEIDDYPALGDELAKVADKICGSKPNVLLVKRITQAGGNNLTGYINDANDPYDDNERTSPAPSPLDTQFWPAALDGNGNPLNPTSFMIGAVNGGEVFPGDDIEYTIYFLSTGTETASDVIFCDRIPDGQTFVPDAFNTNGTVGEDRGIMVSYDNNQSFYTNIGGDDIAQFYPPGSGLPAACNLQITQAEHNGAIVVNLGTIPNATTTNPPANTYGFVRFRAKVRGQ